METLQLVLLLLAYSLGLVTLFVQFICYSRRIEYRETIFLTASFLLLIITVTADYFFDSEPKTTTNAFILIAMVLLGLTTLLNVFKERLVTIQPNFKKGIVWISAGLIVLSIASHFTNVLNFIEYIVSGFLLIAVIYSMHIVRTTKPVVRIKHRERIERITAIVCMIALPLALVIDYLPKYIPFLDISESNPIKLTLPLLFIFIATGKLVDDIKRLSLFQPAPDKVLAQNLKNYNFTKRETEIIDLLVKGSTYNQISETLFISLPTVKTHVSNVYRKAEVKNKVELINLITK